MRAACLLLLSASAALGCTRAGSFTQPTTAIPSVVSFSSPTTTCQPKVVMLWWGNNTADGDSAGAAFGFGALSSDGQMASFARTTNGSDPTNNDRIRKTDHAIVVIDNTGAIIASATQSSLDTDGFTVTWDVADATARIVNFLAIGGPDITNAAVGTYQGNTTGAQAVTVGSTGGFQPDLVILFGAGIDNSAGAGFTPAFGLNTSTNNMAAALGSTDNVATSVAFKRQRTGNLRSLSTISGAGTPVTECTTFTTTSTGFSITCATQGNQHTSYIAIKGGQYKVGSGNQPTASGNHNTFTSIGFTPTAVLIGSFQAGSTTSSVATARWSWGAGTSATSRFALWNGVTDAAATDVSTTYLDRTKIVQYRQETGATSTGVVSADLVSFSSGIVTLNWAADATSRELIYLAIQTTEGSAPPPPTTTSVRRIIRQ
jgi:hypothetical protein